jgi:putative phage-type endonuclease
MKIHTFEQLSPEWFAIRKGKMSASHAQAIATNGKGLETYILELMAEYYSTGEKEQYTNKDIERGLELEETARAMYELETGETVEQVGFIEYDEYTGCSPDGTTKDGLIEIKCLNDKNHFQLLLDGKIETKYLWQIQMQLYITNKKWCDFVAYNPNFKQNLYIKRIKPDNKQQEKIKAGLEAGKLKIKDIINKMK